MKTPTASATATATLKQYSVSVVIPAQFSVNVIASSPAQAGDLACALAESGFPADTSWCDESPEVIESTTNGLPYDWGEAVASDITENTDAGVHDVCVDGKEFVAHIQDESDDEYNEAMATAGLPVKLPNP